MSDNSEHQPGTSGSATIDTTAAGTSSGGKKVRWTDDDGSVEKQHVRLPEISGLWLDQLEIDDGRSTEEADTDLGRFRKKLRYYVDHIGIRLIGVLLVILDIILVVIDLSISNKTDVSQLVFDGLSMALSCIFVVDLLLRIFCYGFKEFFTNPWEVADFIIVCVTFTVTVIYTALDEVVNGIDPNSDQQLVRLVAVARLLRIVRFGRIFYSHHQIRKSSRRTVSQNKRRYQKDGFDLDLTYVTDRVIAMSFPSSGTQSLYRNPIEEVSRFMKTKHPGCYRVYNLCSERSYNEKMFENQVKRVMIDDHNVPKMSDLLDFIVDANTWMSGGDERIIAVHCKGGKGRTGTIICSWLLEIGKFSEAQAALEYFGKRRTDLEVGETFQGVETASQIRYVGYFERVKKEYASLLPPDRRLAIQQIEISSIQGVGRGNGSDLSMEIVISSSVVLVCRFGEQYNCKVRHDTDKNTVTCVPLSFPTLSNDVKIRFTSSDKTLPRGYDNCPFYFWFNTSFVAGNELLLTREQIDNPHKKKTWHIFKPDFAVRLTFSDV